MKQFEWSVRALAQEAEVQLGLYPSFVEVADELALELDEHLRKVDLDLLRTEQRDAIRALDAALEAMSGPDHLDLWEIEALGRAPEWRRVRELAREVVRVMGWPSTPPPFERGALYRGSDA